MDTDKNVYPVLDLGKLIDILKRNAELAVLFDSEGNKEAAIYYYCETVAQIKLATAINKEESIDLSNFVSKAEEYTDRAETLKYELNQDAIDAAKKAIHESSSEYERARFTLTEALSLDEKGLEDDALDLYKEAIQLCITLEKSTNDEKLKKNFKKIARQALERAECIKNPNRPAEKESTVQTSASSAPKPKQKIVIPPLGFEGLGLNDSPSSSSSSKTSSSGGGSGYTEDEKKVLAKTSLINGREYVPFLSADLKERFAFPMPFTDKHGQLALAPKQKAKLVKWARPGILVTFRNIFLNKKLYYMCGSLFSDEFMSDPCIMTPSGCGPFSVKQTLVSDCSFVSSICISAQYEKKYGKKLITSIIYPQDRTGHPVYK